MLNRSAPPLFWPEVGPAGASATAQCGHIFLCLFFWLQYDYTYSGDHAALEYIFLYSIYRSRLHHDTLWCDIGWWSRWYPHCHNSKHISQQQIFSPSGVLPFFWCYRIGNLLSTIFRSIITVNNNTEYEFKLALLFFFFSSFIHMVHISHYAHRLSRGIVALPSLHPQETQLGGISRG